MTDEQLIEAMARAMFKDDQLNRLDIAKALLAVARPIIEAPLRAENEKLQRKLHDATVKYQRLLMQYEPAKAAGLADATFKGDDNVG